MSAIAGAYASETLALAEAATAGWDFCSGCKQHADECTCNAVEVEHGSMFCPSCPALLVLVEVAPGQALRVFTANPTTGARTVEHRCWGARG